MNDVKSEKYGLSTNDIEKKALSSERFKTLFYIERLKRSKKISGRLDNYEPKENTRQRKKSGVRSKTSVKRYLS